MSEEIQEPTPESPEPQAEKQLPVILIAFDADHQRALLKFDNKDFRTWDFVLAVIEMARLQAVHMKAEALEVAHMQRMQLIAHEAEVQEMKERLMKQ